jgi:hypothetical protein
MLAVFNRAGLWRWSTFVSGAGTRCSPRGHVGNGRTLEGAAHAYIKNSQRQSRLNRTEVGGSVFVGALPRVVVFVFMIVCVYQGPGRDEPTSAEQGEVSETHINIRQCGEAGKEASAEWGGLSMGHSKVPKLINHVSARCALQREVS